MRMQQCFGSLIVSETNSMAHEDLSKLAPTTFKKQSAFGSKTKRGFQASKNKSIIQLKYLSLFLMYNVALAVGQYL